MGDMFFGTKPDDYAFMIKKKEIKKPPRKRESSAYLVCSDARHMRVGSPLLKGREYLGDNPTHEEYSRNSPIERKMLGGYKPTMSL